MDRLPSNRRWNISPQVPLFYMHLVHASRTTFRLEVAVLAVWVGLVLLLAANALRPPPVRVSVTSITWSAAGQQLSTGRGWNTNGGSEATLVLSILNFGGAIAHTTATLVEPGFRVLATSLPPIAPGTSGNFTVTGVVPSTSYSGPLEIVLA